MEKRNYTKRELKNLFSNLGGKRTTDDMVAIMIDALWRSNPSLRTSGFYWPGAPDAVLTWNNETRTLLLQPTPVEDADYTPFFRFYTWSGRPVLHRREPFDPETTTLPNPDAVELPNEEGLFMVYYDVNEERRRYELTYAKNPDINDLFTVYTEKVIVAFVYWDYTNQTAVYVGDERHGSEWNPQMHWWAQGAFNGKRIEGLELTNLPVFQKQYNGSSDVHAQVGVTAGRWAHEDIEIETNAVAEGEGWTVFWYSGAGTVPHVEQVNNYPLIVSGGVKYNAGGNSLVVVDEKMFFNTHLFATNCLLNPYIAVPGRTQYATAEECYEGAESEVAVIRETMVHQSALLLGSVMYQHSSSFANTHGVRLVGVWKDECYLVNQSTHGFNVGDPIRYNGTTGLYVASKADSEENSAVHGIVCRVDDAHNFRYRTDGIMPDFGLSAGKQYWLAETGGMTNNPAGLEFTRSLGWVTSHGFKVEIGEILPEIPVPAPFGDMYYLHVNESDITNHNKLLTDPPNDLEGTDEASAYNGDGMVLIRSFVTNPGTPGTTIIPAGNWMFETYVSVSGEQGTDHLSVRVLKRDADGIETELFAVSEEYGYHFQPQLLTIVSAQNDIELAATDRLVVEYYYGTTAAIIKTGKIYMEGAEHYSRIRTPISHGDRYVEDMLWEEETKTLTLKRTDGLEDLEKVLSGIDGITPHIGVNGNWWIDTTDTGIPATGADGEDGREVEFRENAGWVEWRYVGDVSWTQLYEIPAGGGTPGDSAYVYIAYASDDSGTDFTTTFNPALDYIAILATDTEIVTPAVGDFAGLWKKYKGEDGTNGITPHIGVNGNWWIDTTDTGIPATGADGADGREVEFRENAGWVEWRYVGEATWTQLYEIPAGGGTPGDSAYVYIAYASDDSGTDFTTTFNPALDYIAILATDTEIVTPAVGDFAGLWKKYKGEDGTDGITPHIGVNGNWWIDTTDTGIPATGADGADGREVEFRENAGWVEWRYVGEATWTQLYEIPAGGGTPGDSAYVYIAYASDDSGTDFTTTFNPALDYIAILATDTEIVTPAVGDFAGLWKKYKGEDGQDASDSFDVYIDFLDTTEFVYNCPAALKFTQQVSEGTAATLNPVLNTNMAQFDKLTVTPAAVGLVILKGELL